MDATEDYELEYEAESPPRASQEPLMTDANESEEEDHEVGDMLPSDADVEPPAEQEPTKSPNASPAPSPRRAGRKRPLQSDKKAILIASLTRKLAQSQKRNAELQHQLQKLYQNDAIAFLENKAQERQRHIDALQVENRTLLHEQRALNAEIEELRSQVENIPTKRIAQRDELRVCREQLRQYKDMHKATEEKSARLHQQAVDLTTTNKALSDKVRQLEAELTNTTESQGTSRRSASSLGPQEAETVIANQEDEITRLQHRVDVMKKAMKLDQSKHEKQATAARDELTKARRDLEAFHQQIFDKEKVIRSQFLELKQLKRSLKDAVTHIQMNQQIATSGREMRFPNQTHSQSTNKLAASGSMAQELLSKIGLQQFSGSPSKTTIPTSVLLQDTAHGYQRRVPCPPPGTLRDKKTPRSARSNAVPSAPTTAPRTESKQYLLDDDDNTPSVQEPFYEDVDQVTFAALESPTPISIPGPAHSETESSPPRDRAID